MRGAFSVSCRGRVGRAWLQAGWAGFSLRSLPCARSGGGRAFFSAIAQSGAFPAAAEAMAAKRSDPKGSQSDTASDDDDDGKRSEGKAEKKRGTEAKAKAAAQGGASPASLQPSPTDPTTAADGKRAPHLPRSFLAPSSLVARSAGRHG